MISTQSPDQSNVDSPGQRPVTGQTVPSRFRESALHRKSGARPVRPGRTTTRPGRGEHTNCATGSGELGVLVPRRVPPIPGGRRHCRRGQLRRPGGQGRGRPHHVRRSCRDDLPGQQRGPHRTVDPPLHHRPARRDQRVRPRTVAEGPQPRDRPCVRRAAAAQPGPANPTTRLAPSTTSLAAASPASSIRSTPTSASNRRNPR
jgi:hypothetical protein